MLPVYTIFVKVLYGWYPDSIARQQNRLTQSCLLSILFSALNSKYPLDHLLLSTPRLSSTRIMWRFCAT